MGDLCDRLDSLENWFSHEFSSQISTFPPSIRPTDEFEHRMQSQPCHWRKTVSKRDVSDANRTTDTELVDGERKEKTISDNISLFQSLRVLQEGENDEYVSAIQSECEYI